MASIDRRMPVPGAGTGLDLSRVRANAGANNAAHLAELETRLQAAEAAAVDAEGVGLLIGDRVVVMQRDNKSIFEGTITGIIPDPSSKKAFFAVTYKKGNKGGGIPSDKILLIPQGIEPIKATLKLKEIIDAKSKMDNVVSPTAGVVSAAPPPEIELTTNALKAAGVVPPSAAPAELTLTTNQLKSAGILGNVSNTNILTQDSAPVMFNFRTRKFTVKVGSECARGDTPEELKANVDAAIGRMKTALAQKRLAATRKAEKNTAIKTAAIVSSNLAKLRSDLAALQAKRSYVALKEGTKKPSLLSMLNRKYGLNTTKTYAAHRTELDAKIAAKMAEIKDKETAQILTTEAAQAARTARAEAKTVATSSATSVPKKAGLAGMLGFKKTGGRRTRRARRGASSRN